ncbi:MAG: Sb-PDE family phosphodiesterase [Phenylobacterium sp.]|uniref:Sb-PDE family phosphodiesterase n=1 Tax=Phenylobacterium sp. TaxID=1871053 RepID=UPI00391BD352
MKILVKVLAAWALIGGVAHAGDAETRRMTFPNAASGALVLPVDLHTHSVFSDGHVWPSVRVWEAERDGLAAYAVTEHIEYQPHRADIPHPDRNRSYELSKSLAKPDLLVIPGAEVTRSMPPGHVNAVFIADANKLLVDDAEASLKEANDQGAFVFWNHPYWHAQRPSGVAELTDMHRDLIAKKLLHGIEVANGPDLSEEALTIALQNNLTILGTSDVHELVDWDYDVPGGGHRTVTLVLAQEKSLPAIKAALQAGRTVAWYKSFLIGREAHVADVVRGALTMTVADPLANTAVTPVTLANSSPADLVLRNVSNASFYDGADIVTVPARGQITLLLKATPKPAEARLRFEALNTWIAPRRHLAFDIAPR